MFRYALLAALVPAQLGAMDPAPLTAQILPGWQTPDGARMVGLSLSLAPGWKTYWRSPGDAGIAPSFDWSGSENIGRIDILWPAPEVFHEFGLRSIGYKGDVILPLRIESPDIDAPMRVTSQIDLGVCADVCLPYSVSLDVTLPAPSKQPSPPVVAALADLPYSRAEAQLRAASCTISPAGDGLAIDARLELPSAGGDEVVVIEAGSPDIWVSEAQSHRDGAILSARAHMAHSSGGAFSIARDTIRFTILGANYAVDIQGCSAGSG